MKRQRLAESTQGIVNSFPPWSAVRQDEQSLGFQLLNIPGVELDILEKELFRVGQNTNLVTGNINELDVLYKFTLPGSYSFPVEEDVEGIQTIGAPEVSGLWSGTYYSITPIDKNTIEDFWYKALPSRLSEGISATGEFILASGYVFESPMSYSGVNFPNSGILPIPGRCWITVSGSVDNLGLEQGIPRRGMIQLEGRTRENIREQEESIIFLYDDTKSSSREWEEIFEVRAYGIKEEADTTITVRGSRFNNGPYREPYEIANHKDTKDPEPVFWNVATVDGIQCLERLVYEVPFQERTAGYTALQLDRRIELLDPTENTIDNILDMAIQPFSDWIWVLTANNILYIYDRYLYYPDCSVFAKKQYDAIAYIDSDRYHYVLGETATLEYYLSRPIKTPARHRVYVKKPDGNTYLIVNGIEQVYSVSGGWTDGVVSDRAVRAEEDFVLNQRGDWLFTFEVVYVDGTTQTDQRIISVDSKQAIAEFDLNEQPTFLGGVTAVGIDFDSDQKLWILGNNNIAYQLHLHWDTMLIDYDKKILYFREAFEEVRVIE